MFKKIFKKWGSARVERRDLGEEIERANSVLGEAKAIAGNVQDLLTPEGFPYVAHRDGHQVPWYGNAAVVLAEEQLLELEELKAKGATSVEVEEIGRWPIFP
jgi:hypothetical protein